MKNWYRVIMDPDRNPLSILPRAQRFLVMVVLSLMWTRFLEPWQVSGFSTRNW